MLSDLPSGVLVALLVRIRLNAPYGAPCFITDDFDAMVAMEEGD